MRPAIVVTCALTALVCGCEDNRTSKVEELMSANQVRTEDPVAPEAPPPSFKEMPLITIDTIGVKMGTYGATDLAKEKNRKKLEEVVAALPKGETPKIRALQKAKIVDVVETVWLLGKAGFDEVVIETKAKSNGKACNVEDPPADKCLPNKLTVTPASTITKAPMACSIAVTITEKNDVGVWGFGQTGGRKHRPGFGGADLSSAQETVEKNLRNCKSESAFFSAAYNLHWEHAYNSGATIRFMDKDGAIKNLVLMGDEIVAGRPIKMRK